MSLSLGKNVLNMLQLSTKSSGQCLIIWAVIGRHCSWRLSCLGSHWSEQIFSIGVQRRGPFCFRKGNLGFLKEAQTDRRTNEQRNIVFYVLYSMYYILCIQCILFFVLYCILCIILYALYSIHCILFLISLLFLK